MEGGDLRGALSGPLKAFNSWYNNGQLLAMDIVRGVFYLHGRLTSPHSHTLECPSCCADAAMAQVSSSLQSCRLRFPLPR